MLDILIEQNRRLAILNDGTVSDAENTAIQRLADSVDAIRKGREMTAAQSPMGLSPAYWRSAVGITIFGISSSPQKINHEETKSTKEE